MMKVDADSFEVSPSNAEPMFISVNIAGVKVDHAANAERMKWANKLELDHFEGVEQIIFPVASESLVDFLSKQCDAKGTFIVP